MRLMATMLLLMATATAFGQTQQDAQTAVDAANMTNAEALETQYSLQDQYNNVKDIEAATKAEYMAGNPSSDPPGGPWPMAVANEIIAGDAAFYHVVCVTLLEYTDQWQGRLMERMEDSDMYLASAESMLATAIATVNAGGTVTPTEWGAIITEAGKSDSMCAQIQNIIKVQLETRYGDALAHYFAAALMMAF